VPGDSETKKEDFTKWNLRCLAVGGEHNLAVTKKGNVYSWGFNHCGQLGIRSRDSETRPVHLRELKNISRAYCGDSYCFAISDEDHVMYAWGYNNFGQLGLGDTITRTLPNKHSIPPFRDLACGGNHVLAISEEGELFVWGYNRYGQLGFGDVQMRKEPTLLQFPSPPLLGSPPAGLKALTLLPSAFPGGFLKIACGMNHSMALRVNGNLYAWGSNAWGQIGKLSKFSETPLKFLEISNVFPQMEPHFKLF
jgi:alpha-tubulin suppressor-like RCC1 family protein